MTVSNHQWKADLATKLRKRAIESREEAARLSGTSEERTDAEERCNLRAEVWDDVANEIESSMQQEQP